MKKLLERHESRKTDWMTLAICIVLCESAGIVGSLATFSAIPTWYATLVKPTFAPPNWLFGPVWTLLYAMMGIALYLVWQKGLEKPDVKKGMALFGVQLVLNVLWSLLFFGLHNPALALLDIVLLAAMIAATAAQFKKVSTAAALLLVPYLAWVVFAAALNFGIWQLNG